LKKEKHQNENKMTTEENAMLAHRWFTEGWLGNLDIADELFSADFRTNGKSVGPSGPKRNVTNRLTGFPDLQSSLSLFSVPVSM
jgi:hypothetical protein